MWKCNWILILRSCCFLGNYHRRKYSRPRDSSLIRCIVSSKIASFYCWTGSKWFWWIEGWKQNVSAKKYKTIECLVHVLDNRIKSLRKRVLHAVDRSIDQNCHVKQLEISKFHQTLDTYSDLTVATWAHHIKSSIHMWLLFQVCVSCQLWKNIGAMTCLRKHTRPRSYESRVYVRNYLPTKDTKTSLWLKFPASQIVHLHEEINSIFQSIKPECNYYTARKTRNIDLINNQSFKWLTYLASCHREHCFA